MKKKLLAAITIITGIYLLICIALYFFQEKLIFFPSGLEQSYQFDFGLAHEERWFVAEDGIKLHGLLFHVEHSKGLIFYLHGNAGSLSTWGEVAETYTDLGYDIFILDYRGYGKSEGTITNEEQLFSDHQIVYNALKQEYQESNIILLGYSIGSGMAAKLASDNAPKQLILQAPYYNLTDMMRKRVPFAPTFMLKYKFATNEYLKACDMPITLFHGTKDRVIPYKSAVRLKADLGEKVRLIALEGLGHNGMTDDPEYQRGLIGILKE